MGTSWISRKGGILEYGGGAGVWPPLPTMKCNCHLCSLMTDPEVQHGISKMVKKKQCFSLKEKKLWEKFLGALACEPEHDS